VEGPAVATLWLSGAAPGGDVLPDPDRPGAVEVTLPEVATGPEALTRTVVAPDPRTMDLADAAFVVAGGAGLAAGLDDAGAAAAFELLVSVAGALGASAGATRVATDAGWTGHDRQIGTTGVMVHPDLYVALGVAGASQHTGGIGRPSAVVSVNTDPSCPMTAMADLGLVTDARSLLVALARRLEVPVPTGLDGPGGTDATVREGGNRA
jgi:electron transfer flavoprotein alpha subunit